MSSRGLSFTNELYPFGATDKYEEIAQIGSSDRYEEAPQMEQKYAEYWANKDGRTLKRVTSQTRDGGRDFIGIENGNKIIGEVKHWGRPVDRYTLSKYVEQAHQEKADLVIGATNGLTDPAKELAEEHVAETIVGDDLWHSRRDQVIGALSEFTQSTVDATVRAANVIQSQVVQATVDATVRTANVIREFLIKRILMAAWARWKRLSMREKITVGITVIGIAMLIYYGRKYHKDSDKPDSFFEWISMHLDPS